MKRWQLWMGIALLSASTAATALSLGRLRGTPLMGRGLDVSVQLITEAQESLPEANCFSADVFYGEARVSPQSISVSPERMASGESRVRIRASTPVDEPVVTVYLSTTCGATLSRRFVLLAELLTQPDPAPAPVLPVAPPPSAAARSPSAPVPLVSVPPAGAERPAAVPTGNADAKQAGRAQAAERRSARRAAAQELQADRRLSSAQAEPTAAPVRSVMKPKQPSNKGKPRLEVDLLDLTSLEPTLRTSWELASEPSADAAVRAQALALWRSLNASPEDVLQQGKRLDALEAQMRQSLERSSKQEQQIAALSSELEASQKARYLNPFTVVLGLLTLLAVGLSLWLWRRGATQDRPWWRGAATVDSSEEEKLWNHLEDEVLQDVDLGFEDSENPDNSSKARLAKAERALAGSDPQASHPAPLKRAPAPARAKAASAPASPLGASTAPTRPIARFEHTQAPAPAPLSRASGRMPSLPDRHMGYSDFANSNFASSRLVSTEELFDIQEQADFFMSLDQPEQAIAVLKNHITDNVETSALAYMDLFDIYRRTGREAEYEQLREEFNRVFNAQVPDFANYSEFSMGLEEYPQAMATIVQSWPRPQEAQGVIEEYIFRQPDPLQQPFDMLAYRELMLLYAMTKELVKSQSAENMLPTIAALKQAISGEPVREQGLDIRLDLDEPAAAQSSAAEEPAWLKELDQLAQPAAQAQSTTVEAETQSLPPLDFDLSSLNAPIKPGSKN